jgi:hypothetical protein
VKRLIQLILVGAIVGGGYFGWQKFGASGKAAYQVEQVINKQCVALMKKIRDGDAKDAATAIEATKKGIIDEVKAKTGVALNPDDFKLSAAGKKCTASVKVTVGGKSKTISYDKVLQ